MELQEFRVAEALNGNLDVTAAQPGTKFAGEHLWVTPSDNDVCTFLSTVAEDGALPLFDVLDLINKDVVVFLGVEMIIDVMTQIVVCLDKPEFTFLLIYTDNIGIRLLLVAQDEVLQNKTFSHAPLSYQYDDVFLAKPWIHLVGIMFTRDYFHCL